MPKRPRSVNGEGGEVKIAWRGGQLEPKRWCTWENCLQPGKRWRERNWLQGLVTHWTCCGMRQGDLATHVCPSLLLWPIWNLRWVFHWMEICCPAIFGPPERKCRRTIGHDSGAFAPLGVPFQGFITLPPSGRDGPGTGATCNQGRDQIGTLDCVEEDRWGGERHRRRRHCEEIGYADDFPTVYGESGSSHSSFPKAMSTRAGCVCVAHALQGITERGEQPPSLPLTGSARMISFGHSCPCSTVLLQGTSGKTGMARRIPLFREKEENKAIR